MSISVTTTRLGAGSYRVYAALFTATIFLSAFLLFFIQPLFARMVLPKLGGTPAVWSVALAFFQAMLLAGYAYAHTLTRYKNNLRGVMWHILVLSLAGLTLPIALPAIANTPPQEGQIIWILAVFALGVGFPFFALSANAPLLQAWFSRSHHPHAASPYFLYAASNVGSFLALLAYPMIFEPQLSVMDQTTIWSFGYHFLAIGIAICGVLTFSYHGHELWPLPHLKEQAIKEKSAAPTKKEILSWIGLAFIPSGLLVAFTASLTTDIAASPFLWVMTLAIFLLTFVLTFETKQRFSHEKLLKLQLFLVVPVLLMQPATSGLYWMLMLALHVVNFFVVSMVCHGELVKRKPSPEHLTMFFMAMSFGGMLGGIFSGLIAPNIFNNVYEYPMLLLLALLVQPALYEVKAQDWKKAAVFTILILTAALCVYLAIKNIMDFPPLVTAMILSGIMIIVCLLERKNFARYMLVLMAGVLILGVRQHVETSTFTERGFFGVHKVVISKDGNLRELLHGTTLHGIQRINPSEPNEKPQPTLYYAPRAPFGDIMSAAREVNENGLKVGAVGLGTGALSCFAQSKDNWRFYEIDPLVIKIARDSGHFTFLNQCLPNPDIVLGDARLTLEQQENNSLDVLIIDAFSSDAIPTHLMTTEAFALYSQKIKPDGVIALHISNRHLELSSVVAANAKKTGYTPLRRTAIFTTKDYEKDLVSPVTMVVTLTKNPTIQESLKDKKWQEIAPAEGVKPWSDDYANTISAMIRHYLDQDAEVIKSIKPEINSDNITTQSVPEVDGYETQPDPASELRGTVR